MRFPPDKWRYADGRLPTRRHRRENRMTSGVEKSSLTAQPPLNSWTLVSRVMELIRDNQPAIEVCQTIAQALPTLLAIESCLILQSGTSARCSVRSVGLLHSSDAPWFYRAEALYHQQVSQLRRGQWVATPSLLLVPIVVHSLLWGTIVVAAPDRYWQPEEIELVRTLANQCAIALQTEGKCHSQLQLALQESEERFRQLAENMGAVFWIWSICEQRLLYASSAYERVWGRSVESLYAMPQSLREAVYAEDAAIAFDMTERYCLGARTEATYRVVRPNGEIRWIHDRVFPIFDTSGKCYRVAGIAEDITEHKQIEEKLQASLREKEALLKEVHHRVKNNLQIISSLLDLQAQALREPQSMNAFQESQRRVKAMALIHEKLYQSENLSQINLAEYLHSLTNHLLQTFAVNPAALKLQLDIAPVFLDLDTIIPCGLIVSELVSNAIKYGFPGNTEGRIWVTLATIPTVQNTENLGTGSCQFNLIVGNDGVKLPAIPDISKTQTLGFQLVHAWVKQLQGEIEIDQTQGVEFKIRF